MDGIGLCTSCSLVIIPSICSLWILIYSSLPISMNKWTKSPSLIIQICCCLLFLIVASVVAKNVSSRPLSSPTKESLQFTIHNSTMNATSLITHDRSSVWLLGSFFTVLICFSSILGYFIIPGDGSSLNSHKTSFILNGLEGLALGSLLASSIFHLIPHAFDLVGQDNEHNYLSKSLLIFAGIYLFYWSEKVIILFEDWRKRKNDTGHALVNIKSEMAGDISTKEELSESDKEQKSHLILMVVIGDAIHNFIDGLSLGAALNDSALTGFSIAIAILFEEIPHELGEYAILLQGGLTHREAAVTNFLASTTVFFGMATALLLGSDANDQANSSNSYIFALAAGMFLYISLFNIMSDMNEHLKEARKFGFYKSMELIISQNVGFLAGIYLLYSLASFDEKIILDSLRIDL